MHAFMLDLSMISYVLALPLALIVIQQFLEKEIALPIIKYYSMLLVLIYLMIGAAEINLYAEWQTKIDYRAVVYLSQPAEVFETATYTQTFIFFVYLILMMYLLFRLYQFLVSDAIIARKQSILKNSMHA